MKLTPTKAKVGLTDEEFAALATRYNELANKRTNLQAGNAAGPDTAAAVMATAQLKAVDEEYQKVREDLEAEALRRARIGAGL